MNSAREPVRPEHAPQETIRPEVGKSAPAASEDTVRSPAAAWTARAPGWFLLWAGWLLPQLALLGPALVGRTVNVPVDLLALSHLYLPTNATYQHVAPTHGVELIDLILGFPDCREFSAKEFRAGRLPIWQPSNFAGAPFANWPKYSPFELPFYIVPWPITLAWMALLQTLTCGLGMWVFLRGLGLSYWPAALASWCAPLTGFMSLWQGYPLLSAVCWLPWLLVLARKCVKTPWGWSSIALAVLTALLVLSGGSDVGGLVLITTGLYALWLLATEELPRRGWRHAAGGVLTLGGAWILGFLMAAFYVVPMYEYLRTGTRVEARLAGSEERPPVGVAALPAIALPQVLGADRPDSVLSIRKGNRLESSAGACAGILALFWLAALSWRNGALRRQAIFFALLAMAGVAWQLNLPGFVDLARCRPLNMLSFSRWVFATSFAVLVLAAIGLEPLRTGRLKFHSSDAIFLVVAAGFGLWCLFRCLDLPEPLKSQLESAIRHGRGAGVTLERLQAARRTMSISYALGALLSVAAGAGWLTTYCTGRRVAWCKAALIGLIPAQLFWFAWQERRQADRALYFPPVAVLEKLAAMPAGRIWGIDCLPPNLGQFTKLEDIRGYDAVDPARFVKLFKLACDRTPTRPSSYAVTQEAIPALVPTGDHGAKLHPVADLVNVRYLVLRSTPPTDFPVVLHEDDYWVLENRHVLPQAFVPRSVRVVDSDDEALAAMQYASFNPRETAFLSADANVDKSPKRTAAQRAAAPAAEGSANIRYESPTHASASVEMKSAGIVVISDLWDAGWRATLDGTPCPIERADVALTAVSVPAGKHTVELTYAPASVRIGFELAAVGGLLLLAWAGALFWTSRRASFG